MRPEDDEGHNKSVTGTQILHAEAWLVSVERGFCRGIVSQTTLKGHIWFWFILSL